MTTRDKPPTLPDPAPTPPAETPEPAPSPPAVQDLVKMRAERKAQIRQWTEQQLSQLRHLTPFFAMQLGSATKKTVAYYWATAPAKIAIKSAGLPLLIDTTWDKLVAHMEKPATMVYDRADEALWSPALSQMNSVYVGVIDGTNDFLHGSGKYWGPDISTIRDLVGITDDDVLRWLGWIGGGGPH